MSDARETDVVPMGGLTQKASLPDPREDTTVPNFDHLTKQITDDREMKAFLAGWFAHARNPNRVLVEEAWWAYQRNNPPVSSP